MDARGENKLSHYVNGGRIVGESGGYGDVYRRSRSWPAASLGPIYRGIDPLRMVIWEKPG